MSINENDIQTLAIELTEKMNPFAMGDGFAEDTFHFFSGTTFHLRPSDWLKKTIETSKKNNDVLDDQLVWQVYTDWHERLHMLQLVSSPTIANFCFRSSHIALLANSQNEKQLSSFKLDYRLLKYEWDNSRTIEICELQAILLGFFFTTKDNPLSDGQTLIDKFYSSPDIIYVRALKNIEEVENYLGTTLESTFRLVARTCSIALQTKEPYFMFKTLINRLREEKKIDDLINSSPEEFWKWAIGPNYSEMVSKSLRERMASTFNINILDVKWFEQFLFNYVYFEKVSMTERFGLLFGETELVHFLYFSDGLKVYGDGKLNRYYKEDFTLEKKWEHLQFAQSVLDGVEKLKF